MGVMRGEGVRWAKKGCGGAAGDYQISKPVILESAFVDKDERTGMFVIKRFRGSHVFLSRIWLCE